MTLRIRSALVGALIVLGLGLFAAPPGIAAVIYDNGVTPDIGLRPTQFGDLIADDFKLSTAAQLEDFHWTGFAFNGFNPDTFWIRIFGDAGGLPSASPLHTLNVTASVTPGPFIGYAADAPAPIALAADTVYWISIAVVDPLAHPNWFWGADLNDPSGTNVFGNNIGADTWAWVAIADANQGELDFALTGQVPLPGTFFLLGIALFALGFSRRASNASR